MRLHIREHEYFIILLWKIPSSDSLIEPTQQSTQTSTLYNPQPLDFYSLNLHYSTTLHCTLSLVIGGVRRFRFGGLLYCKILEY